MLYFKCAILTYLRTYTELAQLIIDLFGKICHAGPLAQFDTLSGGTIFCRNSERKLLGLGTNCGRVKTVDIHLEATIKSERPGIDRANRQFDGFSSLRTHLELLRAKVTIK